MGAQRPAAAAALDILRHLLAALRLCQHQRLLHGVGGVDVDVGPPDLAVQVGALERQQHLRVGEVEGRGRRGGACGGASPTEERQRQQQGQQAVGSAAGGCSGHAAHAAQRTAQHSTAYSAALTSHEGLESTRWMSASRRSSVRSSKKWMPEASMSAAGSGRGEGGKRHEAGGRDECKHSVQARQRSSRRASPLLASSWL